VIRTALSEEDRQNETRNAGRTFLLWLAHEHEKQSWSGKPAAGVAEVVSANGHVIALRVPRDGIIRANKA
jgi:hypothetical protein